MSLAPKSRMKVERSGVSPRAPQSAPMPPRGGSGVPPVPFKPASQSTQSPRPVPHK